MKEHGSSQVVGSEPLAATEATVESFVFPASYAQQRLWLLDQLEPGSHVYNIGAPIHLEGHLNVRALGESLNEVVRRHEVLRTTFSASDGKPMQVIASSLQLAMPFIDLQPLEPAEQQARVRRAVSEEA